MSEARSSSKRQLTFSSPPVSRSAACTLCNQFHTQVSSPNSWKNDSCRQFAQSLDISGHCLVCRPCCNDITRLKKDPSHRPRWEKCRVTECTIPNTERIQSYLAEKTGYEGVLKDGNKVCFACYKSHLQILKHSQIHSIDTDLVELIQVVKSSIIHVNDVSR